MILTVSVIIACGIIFVTLYILNHLNGIKFESFNKIPGPPGYPIIGNVLEFFTTSEIIWSKFRVLAKEYYPIYKYYHMSIPILNILSPEDMNIVMSSSTHIAKGPIYLALEPWLGTGLLTSAGSKWHQRRKLLTPTFHFNILQQFMVTFNEHAQELVKKLQVECSKPFTNIVPLITETTLHLISETAMGTHLNTTTKSSQEYMRSLHRFGEVIVDILVYPWYQIIIILIFTPKYWEMRKLVRILHEFSKSVIKKRKESFDTDKATSKRMALLDMLIKAQKLERSIDDEGIREEVDTFMFEGHDTTTACISFTLFLLANHPNIQAKVLDEMTNIFGESDRMPTFQDLQNMNYLEQVIKESLRMYPSVPFVSRVAEEDFQTSSKYTIPKGTIIQLHIYDLHHNEQIYPQPEKFDPERFSVENCKNRHPYAYIPFSAGPRNCIGQRFALLEIKTLISTVLRNYELIPVDTPADLTLVLHLILKSKHGIKISFRRRK